jgi:hypothetical protein
MLSQKSRDKKKVSPKKVSKNQPQFQPQKKLKKEWKKI